jgi:hypothetical protein
VIAKTVAVVGERRKHMQESIRLLSLQRDAAQQALARAERKVGEAINSIFVARAEREAGRVARLFQELWDHHDRLAAMSGLWLQGPNGFGPLRLSSAALTIVQKIGGIDHRFGNAQSRHTVRLWKEALLSDADAELD